MTCLTRCTGWMLRSGLHGWSKARALRHHAGGLALMQHDFVLARIRLTRTAAERGPVLSGACGQDGLVEISRLRMGARTNAHTPPDA